jgi:predicted kinase
MLARVLLWEMGVPIMIREQIAGLIRSHQVPFFLIDRPDRERLLFELSQSVRLDYLGLVAEADARGRVCADGTRLLENIALFLQYAREEGCLDRPREFPSALSRFEYFARDDRSANYLAYDNTRVDTVVMSGLPGAGKDTWIAENLPRWKVISLDRLREEMKIAADCPQGQVVQRARAIAREFLRRGESFVWSATNTSREVRSNVVRLLRSYNARVRIVYVEAPAGELYRRNRERKRVVPEEVITRLLNRWEPPSITEGHEVDWVT